MALRRPPQRDPYRLTVLLARRRWDRLRVRTEAAVRVAYRDAARALRVYAAVLPAGAPAGVWAERMAHALDEAVRRLSEDVLRAVRDGVRLSVEAASAPGRVQTLARWQRLPGWRELVDGAGLDRVYRDLNDRAVLAHVARTGPGGLSLSQRIWSTQRVDAQRIAARMRAAIAGGDDPRRAAAGVADLLQPGARTPHRRETARRLGVRQNLPAAALRLVRTEMGQAFHEGTILGHGATPGYRGVYWRLSASHPVRDVCDALAESEAYGEPGFYPPGYEPPKPHPNCLCVIIPATEDLDAFAERLVRWQRDPASEPDLESWYERVGRRYLRRRRPDAAA